MPEITVVKKRGLPRLRNRLLSYVIHVDTEVLKAIYSGEKTKKTRIVRVLTPAGRKFYCHHVSLKGPAWLATTWDKPLPDRPRAICVLRTRHAIVMHGR